MKIEIFKKKYYPNKIIFFYLFILNLLDVVLTYIVLYIIPDGIFYEKNKLAVFLFDKLGFVSATLLIKFFLVVLILSIIYYFIFKFYHNDSKVEIIYNNVFLIILLIGLFRLIQIILLCSLNLIIYYYF